MVGTEQDGGSRRSKRKDNSLYSKLRRRLLWDAWRKIRHNGLKSTSRTTRELIKQFDTRSDTKLLHIANALSRRAFVFEPQAGVLIPKRSGKGKRPLVLAPVANRVVQRALLDLLQGIPEVERIVGTSTSFGGVPGRSTAAAIAMARKAIRSGSKFFIRSDIDSFFTKIPREKVQGFVRDVTGDLDISSLFGDATATNLVNLEELGDVAGLFPLNERGIPQGNPLSPLAGNILLSNFDRELNNGNVVCIRYIDDFLLLAPNEGAARQAFRLAKRLLKELGMNAYSPWDRSRKATTGITRKGFEFLGCFVNPEFVEPSQSSRERLMNRVDDILADGRREIRRAAKGRGPADHRFGFVQSLRLLDLVLQGWGHSLSFCDKRDTFESLDQKVDRRITSFENYLRQMTQGKGTLAHRRALGVQALADIPGLGTQAKADHMER